MFDSSIEMLVGLYNAIMILIPVALILAFWQLAAAIVGWRTEFRNRRLFRFGMLVASALLLPLLLTVLWSGVIRPAMGAKSMAEVSAKRIDTLASSSLIQIGDAVPTLTTETTEGETVIIPSEGDVTIINFFATWCGPCLVELPHIEKIWLENKDNPKFKLLAIGREESVDALVQFRAKHGFTLPMCADLDRSIFSRFARESIPRTLIVGPDRRVVYSKVGFMEWDLVELKYALEKQLSVTANK